MLKILALSGFIGGLVTVIVTYTCNFFGIDIEDAKDTVVETDVKGENK